MSKWDGDETFSGDELDELDEDGSVRRQSLVRHRIVNEQLREIWMRRDSHTVRVRSEYL